MTKGKSGEGLDPSEYTVAELEDEVEKVESLEELESILDQEVANKDRVTAKEAIQSRIDEVSEWEGIGEEDGDGFEETVEERMGDALESVDKSLDSLLYEILETRSRVAVYVGLRKKDGADLKGVVEETGLAPDKVEKVVKELEDEDVIDSVDDEYHAISPTALVRRVPDRVGSWIDSTIRRGEKEEEETVKVE